MFTGIIEEIGSLQSISKKGQTLILHISAERILSDIHLGDSIAVNGVCLTVVEFSSASFSVDVMPETYRKTNLSRLMAGSPVNLERAMSHEGRFGGHIVQGHVDTVGRILSRKEEENAVVFGIAPERTEVMKYIVSQGSITIDGISLTVVSDSESDLTVSIIPHTLAQTVLKTKRTGDSVNLECDILGKYVERLLFFQNQGKEKPDSISEQFLAEHGFI